jgi:hypothetical protein
LREVRKPHIHAGLKEAREEGYGAREAVNLGNHDRDAVDTSLG